MGKIVWNKLLFSFSMTLGLGLLSAFLISGEVSGPWFVGLRKPFFNPPSWVFAPVWTVLYVLAGIAFYMATTRPKDRFAKVSTFLIVLHSLSSFCWPLLFFNLHLLKPALVCIAILWVLTNITIGLFNKQNRLAAWLLVPYMVWISFAGVLNYTFWLLNRDIERSTPASSAGLFRQLQQKKIANAEEHV